LPARVSRNAIHVPDGLDCFGPVGYQSIGLRGIMDGFQEGVSRVGYRLTEGYIPELSSW
jgi:hypothetical protein